MLPRDACRGERVWAAAGGWQQGTLWATGHAQVGRMWGDVHVGWGAVICTPRPPGDTCLAKPKGISLAHNKAGRRALWDGQSPPSGALSLEKQFPGLWAGQWEQTGHCCGAQCREGGGERPLTASLARPYGPPFCSVCFHGNRLLAITRGGGERADDARGWQCPFVLCLHPQGCLRRGVLVSCGAREVRSPCAWRGGAAVGVRNAEEA